MTDSSGEKQFIPRDERQPFELPVRVDNPNGRGIYFLSFVSEQAARAFLLAFWAETDMINKTPGGSLMRLRFEAGNLDPIRDMIDNGCRTFTMRPATDEQKQAGATILVSVGGNGQRLLPFGVQALRNLGVQI